MWACLARLEPGQLAIAPCDRPLTHRQLLEGLSQAGGVRHRPPVRNERGRCWQGSTCRGRSGGHSCCIQNDEIVMILLTGQLLVSTALVALVISCRLASASPARLSKPPHHRASHTADWTIQACAVQALCHTSRARLELQLGQRLPSQIQRAAYADDGPPRLARQLVACCVHSCLQRCLHAQLVCEQST